MKGLILGLGLALAATAASAATIAPTDAAAHPGETVMVEGTVAEVFVDRHSGITFVDFGARYPKATFTAVILAADAKTFPDAKGLAGKTVDITGTVRLYKGRPEIVLKSADQIKEK